MEFEPKSEREIRDAMVLAPGVYDFEVTKAEEKISKKGNAMIELTLKVFPADGGSARLVRDWLVSSMELKLNRFCRTTGLFDAYNSGALTAFACEGVAGRVKLTVDASSEFGDRNSVKDYMPDPLPSSAAKVISAPTAQADKAPANNYEEELAAKGDDIPF